MCADEVEQMLNLNWVDIFVAVFVGVPIGLFLPTRPKYLLIDIVISIAFFLSLSVTRLVQDTYNGTLGTVFVLFIIFLISAYVSSNFNTNAQEKEQLIKYLDEYPRGEKGNNIPPIPPKDRV